MLFNNNNVPDWYMYTQNKEINEKGIYSKVRAKWGDGTQSATYSITANICKYDDIERNFPITISRDINYKSSFDEILWIYQKMSNNVKDLNSKIWDAWADKNGSIGQSYGAILRKEYEGFINNNPDVFGDKPYLNQVEYLFQELCQNPSNRRIMTNMFDFNELNNTQLPPCAFQTMWSVLNDTVHMTLIQRSGDFLVAGHSGGWNCVQYAFLLSLVARCCGYKVGSFNHFIQNLHLYDRHKEKHKEFLDNLNPIGYMDKNRKYLEFDLKSLNKEHDLKVAWEEFKGFTLDQVVLHNYNPRLKLPRLEVAE